jgi:hypothetical protein
MDELDKWDTNTYIRNTYEPDIQKVFKDIICSSYNNCNKCNKDKWHYTLIKAHTLKNNNACMAINCNEYDKNGEVIQNIANFYKSFKKVGLKGGERLHKIEIEGGKTMEEPKLIGTACYRCHHCKSHKDILGKYCEIYNIDIMKEQVMECKCCITELADYIYKMDAIYNRTQEIFKHKYGEYYDKNNLKEDEIIEFEMMLTYLTWRKENVKYISTASSVGWVEAYFEDVHRGSFGGASDSEAKKSKPKTKKVQMVNQREWAQWRKDYNIKLKT